MKFVNTRYFSEEANTFTRTGSYCSAPEGTFAYREYWDEQERRCKEGYTVGGVHITGEHYAYLNFGRIKVTTGEGKTARKYESFPRFLDMDYYYYHELEKAKNERQGMIVAKSRRKGFEQPNSEKVLTETGWRPIGELKIGDKVYTPKGTLTPITDIYPQGKKDVYEVHLHDGRKVKCGLNHLWKVHNKMNHNKLQVHTTEALIKRGLFGKTKAGGKEYKAYRFGIPEIDPIQYPKKKLKIPPYVMGALLGDGSLGGKQIRLSSNDPEIFQYLEKDMGGDYYFGSSDKRTDSTVQRRTLKYKYHHSKLEENKIFKNYQYGVNPLCRHFQEYSLKDKNTYTKFIPEDYLTSDFDDRLSLLQGLLDTDGYINKDSYDISYTTCSRDLQKDIMILCRSLGINCSVRYYPEKEKSSEIWCVHIKSRFPIFRLKRKAERQDLNRERFTSTPIIDIIKLDYQEESTCIEVQDEDHCYITTDFVPTHNSYKGSFNCVYEYNWYRDSFNIIAAFLKDYCQSTMNMAIEMLNFINKHTDWGKRKLIDKRDHIKAGFKETINGIQVESGFKSEITIISFKDDPFKSIGKSASVMLFEEAGKWRGLIEAYMLSKPLFSDGNLMTGIPIVYGTGGDMEDGTQDFAEMFYSPKAYNLRAYENIYDENAAGECGWFVDDMWFKLPHVDKDGNSDRVSAEKELDLQRDMTKKKSSSKKAYDTLISQHPKTPQEAFLKTKGEIFPTRDLQGVLARLELDKDYEKSFYKGFFSIDENGKSIFEQSTSKIIYNYPLKKEDNTDTPCILYEQPFQYEDQRTPPGMYIAGCDSYDIDQSSTGSLGSCFIINKLTKRIVAEYTSRPQTSKHFYEQVRRLLMYYNAQMLYENQNKGIFDYFESKNSLHLLCLEPTLTQDLIKRPSPTRKFGTKMPDQIKRHCENLMYNYLVEDIDDSSSKQNLHTIRSIGLLKELIAYDGERNTDRVSAMFTAILQLEEERRFIVNIERDDNYIPFHKRGFFNRKPNLAINKF